MERKITGIDGVLHEVGRRVGDRFVGMSQAGYSFRREDNSYFFTSAGRREIRKSVTFNVLGDSNTFNLCLADHTFDGETDDMANTNNGDMVKVIATVIEIIVDFLNYIPPATVIFRGNTDSRMNLYGRIIKRYHLQYSSKYNIGGLVWKGDQYVPEMFDHNFQEQYEWYFIKKKY